LSLIFSILINQIAPVLLAAGAGFAIGRAFQLDIRSITRVTFYIFSPCLVFVSLYETQLTGDEFGRMALFAAGVIISLGILAFLFGKLIGLNRSALTGLVVINMFGNGGNYGLPLTLFAFGETALARAVIYYVVSTVMVYSVGILVASSKRSNLKESLTAILKLPVLYGVVVATVLKLAHIELPTPLFRATELLSQAALPVMLVVLGLQLSQMTRLENLRVITAASVFQLLSGPAVGLLMAGVVGLSGPARQAGVLEASMPTAVITTILAVEYDIDPAFVTGIVLVTTLLSPFTLAPLIAYLGS
jgi:malate permease and related proteins